MKDWLNFKKSKYNNFNKFYNENNRGMEAEVIDNKEKREEELNFALNQFFKMLYVDFGLRVNRKIKGWYNMSWEEFKEELARNRIRISDCLAKDWEYYFHNHKRKVLSLMYK